jgi:ribA/ribD-fused uncharacterized protein
MFRNAKHLRGSGIFLKDDVCKNTQRKQTMLKPILNLAREEDRHARFINDKILFQGQLYSLDNHKNMPIDTERATCRKGNGVTVFSGELCPLSNLHPVSITIDGKPYGSSEHFYQTRKCEELGNTRLAAQVYQAETPRQAMEIGKTLRPTQQWTETVGAAIMTKGVAAKFQINKMKEFLLGTKGAIGEGTKHPHWGIGHNMHTKDALLVTNWDGSNLMGKILTELRENIAQCHTSVSDASLTNMEF